MEKYERLIGKDSGKNSAKMTVTNSSFGYGESRTTVLRSVFTDVSQNLMNFLILFRSHHWEYDTFDKHEKIPIMHWVINLCFFWSRVCISYCKKFEFPFLPQHIRIRKIGLYLKTPYQSDRKASIRKFLCCLVSTILGCFLGIEAFRNT